MTYDEHYTEAERLLELTRYTAPAPGAVDYALAAAQVHATLALAAATANAHPKQEQPA